MKKHLLFIPTILLLAASCNQRIDNVNRFGNKTDCESKTGTTCAIVQCDYVPKGKTYEEVCPYGQGYWQSTGQKPASNNEQQTQNQNQQSDKNRELETYSNSKYHFEFQYPNKTLSVAEGYVSSIDPKGVIGVVNIFTVPHGQDKDGDIRIFDLPLAKAAQSVGFGEGALQVAKTVNKNGIAWTVIYAQEGDTRGHYLTERGGKTFWLSAGDRISQSDFEGILNTFKFSK